jgi:hypothetical protein
MVLSATKNKRKPNVIAKREEAQMESVYNSSMATFDCINFIKKKGKAIPVTDHGGPKGCETLRPPHYLNSRPTNGGEVVSLTRRPPFTPQEDSWYSFLLEAE